MAAWLPVALVGLSGCAPGSLSLSSKEPTSEVKDFLDMYNATEQRLGSISNEAQWLAETDISELHTGQRIGANRALAAFRGSRYVIERAKVLLDSRDTLSDLEFRQLDNILLAAAESPGTIPDIVSRRIEAEAKAAALLDGFEFCLEQRNGKCLKPVSSTELAAMLAESHDLKERRRYWEVSKQSGVALKPGLAELRDLRNRLASELGYSSYFHLQVADYGMSVAEMMQLMEKTLDEVRPLYEQLHLHARRQLAGRYSQPMPQRIPAHWISNRWAEEWPGLVEEVNFDKLFTNKTPEWVVKQAERFYISLGWPWLPKSFWERSDLYPAPANSGRRKSAQTTAWHIDYDTDVRCLMNVVPNLRWFEASHAALGKVYYDLAYSNDKVPVVLRRGANRAFHEAVGELIAIAARQPSYLRSIGLLPEGRRLDEQQVLLAEALDNAIVFLPFAAGTVTHFEHDLYEKRLPSGQFNRRWWELAAKYQGIVPPSPRGEEFCDACTKPNIIDEPARYYDYALAYVIKFQLHDYIARKILKQDPRNCSYYGNKEVGRWLWDILSQGATTDWRTLIREKTGEDLSTRAMLDYFRPLLEYLKQQNGAESASWQ